jgi:hypothetical protein
MILRLLFQKKIILPLAKMCLNNNALVLLRFLFPFHSFISDFTVGMRSSLNSGVARWQTVLDLNLSAEREFCKMNVILATFLPSADY